MAVNTEPAWYQEMVKANAVHPGYGAVPPEVTVRGEGGEPNTTTFICGKDEMLKFSDKGFWVRGVKVKQDDKEAEVVYNAFKAWLTWQQLNGYYT